MALASLGLQTLLAVCRLGPRATGDPSPVPRPPTLGIQGGRPQGRAQGRDCLREPPGRWARTPALEHRRSL